MKQIVWIMGTSAVGKETFMHFLVEHPDDQIVSEINLSFPLVVSEQSLKNVVHAGDSRAIGRLDIINEVIQLTKSANTILIKWQYADSKMQIPQKLLDAYPQARHRIILLHIQSDLLDKRLGSRTWWNSIKDKKSFVKLENKIVTDSVNQLSAHMERCDVDASTRYTVIYR